MLFLWPGRRANAIGVEPASKTSPPASTVLACWDGQDIKSPSSRCLKLAREDTTTMSPAGYIGKNVVFFNKSVCSFYADEQVDAG